MSYTVLKITKIVIKDTSRSSAVVVQNGEDFIKETKNQLGGTDISEGITMMLRL